MAVQALEEPSQRLTEPLLPGTAADTPAVVDTPKTPSALLPSYCTDGEAVSVPESSKKVQSVSDPESPLRPQTLRGLSEGCPAHPNSPARTGRIRAPREASKGFLKGSRVQISVDSEANSLVIHIPPGGIVAFIFSLNLWSCKKLVLAWGLFLYLSVWYFWSVRHGTYPGFEPFSFGCLLLAITSFVVTLRLVISGALVDEEVHLEDQRILLGRQCWCQKKTVSLDKCEVLGIEDTERGVLIKCAGVALLGFPKRYFVGRCLSSAERKMIAFVLQTYINAGA